ncbi:Os05g0525850 [Oryza sativa Japonica Group]|uniref:Os05g0525850 protein n=1 Tax=Oryza sativa subsp. japonica TaxID=39947 RepID=A0A0P0WPN0_ORYSJ|nr:hypothetical protein EE612_030734 [Oryza sativa]BAS94986.1 Os05g0525850 [Oryza sativa Japonica Group]
MHSCNIATTPVIVGRCIDSCMVHLSAMSTTFHTLLMSWSPCMRASTTSSMLPRARCCCTHWIMLVLSRSRSRAGFPVTNSNNTTPKL